MHSKAPEPKKDPDAEARARIQQKAEDYLRQHPAPGPAVFEQPEALALVDLDSQHYPHFTCR